MYVKIVNERGLVRDLNSKAVINTDVAAFNKYTEQKRRVALLKEEAIERQNNLDTLKSEVVQLQQQMKQLLSLIAKEK